MSTIPTLSVVFWLGASMALEAKEDAISVRIREGWIQEHVNGSLRRSYGNGLVAVATDGRIHEYKNGGLLRTYGNKVKGVSIRNGRVFAQLEDGRTAEYANGSHRRTF